MDSLFTFGIDATRWLQDIYPQLEGFFQFISQLGREEFYLALLPLIYWCLDKRFGKQLAYVFLTATAFNAMLKHAFRGPRPYWLESSIGLSQEESYGVPSGHTQLATAFYFMVAVWLRRPWVWLLAILMALLMGVSRVYLGMHFVHDVGAGFLIAVLLVVAYILWRRYLEERFSKRILGYRLMVSAAVPLALAVIYVGILLLIGAPDSSVQWAAFIPDAELSGMKGMATSFGALLGLSIGIVLEGSRVRFMAKGPIWKRITRYIIGFVITVGIWGGLRAVFPSDPLWLALPLRILRYFLTLLWIGLYAPMSFVRLGLAEVEPDPGITMTM
ncbi:MAG: phosphatase PAP2 family protein [Anaerolineae bacterium]